MRHDELPDSKEEIVAEIARLEAKQSALKQEIEDFLAIPPHSMVTDVPEKDTVDKVEKEKLKTLAKKAKEEAKIQKSKEKEELKNAKREARQNKIAENKAARIRNNEEALNFQESRRLLEQNLDDLSTEELRNLQLETEHLLKSEYPVENRPQIEELRERVINLISEQKNAIPEYYPEEEAVVAKQDDSKEEREAKAKEYFKLAEEQGKRLDALVDARNKATPEDPESETPIETEEEILEEIKAMPKVEREKLGWGFNRMGFWIEQKKHEIFADVFRHFADTNLDQNKTTTLFVRKLADFSERDAETAHKKAKQDKEGAGNLLHKATNLGSITKNAFRYGRIAFDLSHKSFASPLRYVMMAGMAFTRASEAAKEVRFDNKGLKDQTRITKADDAAKEAWTIYERAREKLGVGPEENVPEEALANAYLMEMPEDLKRRLEAPAVANTTMQGIFKMQVGFSINRLNGKIQKIEENKKLTKEQKEAKKEKLLKSWQKDLQDYDRTLTEYGTLDTLAMLGRWAQTAGKTVVRIVTAETIILSLEKVAESITHMFSNGSHEGVAQVVKDSVNKAIEKQNSVTHDTFHTAEAKADATAVAHNPADTLNTKTDIEKLLKHDTEKAADKIKWWEHSKVSTPSAVEHAPTTPSVPHGITSNFSVKLGENGVPPHAETMFHEIAADHMQAPEGGMIDEKFATKSINIAENLVKLSEHHGVPGVSSEDFDRVASFKDGVLQVKDHVGFNQLLDKLQTHSDELWDKGVLQGRGAAISQIQNITHDSWLKIGHADGMPHDVVAGHADITDVKNFSDSELVKKAMEVGEAKAKVLSAMDSSHTTAPSFKSAMEHSAPTQVTKSSAEEFLKATDKAPQAPTPQNTPESSSAGAAAIIAAGAAATAVNLIRERDSKNIATDNPFNLPADTLKKVNTVYKGNIATIFSGDTKDLWASARKNSAEELLTKKDADVEKGLAPLVKLLRKLYELTGLEPKSETLIRPAETNDEFMQRALQKAAEMGELDKVKI